MKKRLTLEAMALERLGGISEPLLPGQILPFPRVFKRLCPIFCMPKETAWEVLRNMEKEGMIFIVRNHGIRIRSKE